MALLEGAPHPWFTPLRLLCLFCAMNMLIYVDRGVISSNGVNGARPEVKGTVTTPGFGIMGDFALSYTQDGLLPAAFMVGLLIASPIFAESSKYCNALRLIGIGLGVWTLATAACGLSFEFNSLAFFRMFVGVGEASFVSLAAPFIDDNAPPAAKTRWLATFYLCIPVGYAIGYIFGGVVAASMGWRAAFFIEAAAMVPFVLFCLLAPPIDLRGTHDEDPKEQGHKDWRGAAKSAYRDLCTLGRHPVYIFTVVGATIYTGVIGTYAYWGPKAGLNVFPSLRPESADITFGAITVVTGVVGTVLGGVLLDRLGSSMRNALAICAIGTLVGFVCVLLSFVAAADLSGFAPLFAAGQLGLFATQAPSNAVAMWAVPTGLRPFAISTLIVVIHLFGDVPAPPLLGWVQGRLDNWRLSMAICTLFLLLSAAAFLQGILLSRSAPDYRETRDQAQRQAAERDPEAEGEDGAADEEERLDEPLLNGDAGPAAPSAAEQDARL